MADIVSDSLELTEDDFFISLSVGAMPFRSLPVRLETFGYVCLCTGGSLDIEIGLHKCSVAEGDILMLLPGHLVSGASAADDFRMMFFRFSTAIIDEIIHGLPGAFMGFLKENFAHSLSQAEASAMRSQYFEILHQKFADDTNIFRRRLIINLLQNFFLDVCNNVQKHHDIAIHHRRKSELQNRFFSLLISHYAEHRDVAFYADRLCISPKYLSMVTQECSGSLAKELIDKYVTTEIKLRLKSTSQPLKTIAAELDFPSEAFLCKYFKRHAGVSPVRYRNSMK